MLKGLIAATHTPFDHSGKINVEGIPPYVEYLLRTGMDGLYVNGSTGEGSSLSVEERHTVLEVFLESVDHRIPVVAQVGANSLTDCVKMAEHAQKIGVSALSASAPGYFKIRSSSMLVEWMAEIAAAAPSIPFYYYHIPRFTGIDIDLVSFLDEVLAITPNFVGLKYTDFKLYEFLELIQYGDKKLNMLWGCDEMLLPALSVGASGAVGSTYPLCNQIFRNLWTAWKANDFENAALWQLRSWKYVKAMTRYGDLLATQRCLLKRLGVDLGPCRKPIALLSNEKEQQLMKEMEETGYFQWQSDAS